MKLLPLLLLLSLLLTGCAGGPTKDYYNPATTTKAPSYSGQVVMTRVDNVRAETERLTAQGYTLLGTTIYGGKHPEAVELKAQARRVNASHVLYSSEFVPNPPGTWSFGFNQWGGGGGSGGGRNNVNITFLRAPELK